MNKLIQIKNDILDSLTNIWPEVVDGFLNLLKVIVILFIGWIAIKLILRAIKRLLKLVKANKLDDRLNDIEIVEGKKLNFDTISIILKFVKVVLYISLFVMISDVLGLKMITEQIGKLLNYLPQLFSSLAIFTLGLLFANFVKKGIRSLFDTMDLSGGKLLSQAVFFLILTFISITALNQAGINTEIITDNINMIIGSFLVAFALAFGFGAKEVVGKLLKTFYARKTFEVGENIIFNDKVYTIDAVENISIILKEKDKEGKLIVPIDDIVESQVQMQD